MFKYLENQPLSALFLVRSSATRAVVAWVYLQLHGLEKVRILDARYPDLTVELNPGKVYKLTH